MTSNSLTSDDYAIKETATLNWTIEDFRDLTFYADSDEFSPPNSKNAFELFLNSKTKFFMSENVCITLWYNEYANELHTQYRVSILNANGESQYSQEYRWNYKQTDVNSKFLHLNYTNFIDNQSCLKYLVNGNLILRCEVDVLRKSQVNHQVVDLQNDYQAMLDNSEFSDAVLLVKGKEFKAHKAILAARSKVFRAMFINDLEEKKQNKVEITDVEVDVFEHLLRYIYTGKIPEMDEYALELFVTADKYQLDHLKSTCLKSLGSILKVESVVRVLVIADMHNASDLKSKCIEYINANSSKVIGTADWNQITSRPDLLKELYEKKSNVSDTKKQRTK